jgi:3-oxoacyl-(acyl-carrier-protein) synthase
MYLPENSRRADLYLQPPEHCRLIPNLNSVHSADVLPINDKIAFFEHCVRNGIAVVPILAAYSSGHQILGPVITHSAACASSGVAIGDAFRSIRHGIVDVAVAGGAEASLIPVYFGAWDGLRALAVPDPADPARSCKPFSTQRNGLVLAEGAVFFVLESAEHAGRRGAQPYCRLSGYGIAADAHHIGAPSARGQAAAMAAAIDDAGLRAPDIGYINAHATATPGGDPIEAAAIRKVFAAVTDDIPVSGTKSIHGHMLGAASAMELAVCILAIRESFLPATANLDEIDPQCRLRHVANHPLRGCRVDHALSLSAGFGGTNVALLVSALDAPRSRS